MARERIADSLYCRPSRQTFGPGEFDNLEHHLSGIARHTTVSPISDPEELMYGTGPATKRGGYRYTALSFKQVAQILAPGLSTILPDLAGVILRKNIDDDMISAVQARNLFNVFINLRFPLLRTYRILRNEQNKTIDGVIGQKHRSLENLTMLAATDDAIKSVAGSDMPFHAGMVNGRRMMLWYRSRSPMFSREIDDKPWSFYYGYYFRNAESTGTSVRGALTVYTKHGTCLAPFTKHNRVTHIGRDFNQRLAKMFQHILGPDVPVQKFAESIDRLLTTPLGYVDLDERQRRAFTRKMIAGLQDLGMSQGWAAECFEEALKVGRVRPEDLRPRRDMNRQYASRTFFDVLCPVIRMASRLPFNRREGVEQVAYQVLIGKLKM